MRRKKKLPIIEKVEIIDMGAEGKAIAKVDKLVLFVTHTVPGDVVDVQLTRKRKNFLEGFPVKFHQFSEIRATPFCEHFGVCGGCKWQNLPYEYQLEHKQKMVNDILKHIGTFDFPDLLPILPSVKTTYYRNKLEFTFSNKRWLTEEEMKSKEQFTNMQALGFHIPKMFDKVLDIKNCYLQKEPSNKIRLLIKEIAEKDNLTFFDIKKQEGFLRNLIIRTSSIGEIMVILSLFYEDEEKRVKLLNDLADRIPNITSIMYVINSKPNDTITDQDILLYKGRDHIVEEMEGMKFKIGPKSFFQTNSEQAYELYKVVKEFAMFTKDQVVYDLYTGTGTIANFIACNVKKVVGLEYVQEAIEDAKENATINKITNTHFFSGDIKDVLTNDFVNLNSKPDTIIVDPPRAGMHKDVVNKILNIQPHKIVYVSCNPATQARDINILKEKYNIRNVQPVDMFPHTHHVENVVLLEKS